MNLDIGKVLFDDIIEILDKIQAHQFSDGIFILRQYMYLNISLKITVI